jgi:hypothetical protein
MAKTLHIHIHTTDSLQPGSSKAAFQHNVKTEIEASKPQKQAVAIAYSKQRETHDNWEESKHPRAANGQFGSGGGGAKASPRPVTANERKEPGQVRSDVISTINKRLASGTLSAESKKELLEKKARLLAAQSSPSKGSSRDPAKQVQSATYSGGSLEQHDFTKSDGHASRSVRVPEDKAGAEIGRTTERLEIQGFKKSGTDPISGAQLFESGDQTAELWYNNGVLHTSIKNKKTAQPAAQSAPAKQAQSATPASGGGEQKEAPARPKQRSNAKTESYSWGKLTTVSNPSITAVAHPEDRQAIHTLGDGEVYKYTDEQKHKWEVSRHGDEVYFTEPHSKTAALTAKRSDFE